MEEFFHRLASGSARLKYFYSLYIYHGSLRHLVGMLSETRITSRLEESDYGLHSVPPLSVLLHRARHLGVKWTCILNALSERRKSIHNIGWPRFSPWDWEDPLEKGAYSTPVFFPWKVHDRGGWGGLLYGGCKELDTAERPTFSLFHFSLKANASHFLILLWCLSPGFLVHTAPSSHPVSSQANFTPTVSIPRTTSLPRTELMQMRDSKP